jgi:group I intron endonuclease
MYHIVYKTTNLITGNYYIGVHKTADFTKFDGYYGSGKILKQAIKKYGKENFLRTVIAVYNTPESAFHAESLLVNESTISDPMCYNIKIGGDIPPKFDWNGRKHSNESKIKISKNRSGLQTGDQHWSKSEKHSDTNAKNKDRLRERNLALNSSKKFATGHFVSEEQRQASSEFNRKLRWWRNVDTGDVVFCQQCPEGYISGSGSIKTK